jgi:hypothetical protein
MKWSYLPLGYDYLQKGARLETKSLQSCFTYYPSSGQYEKYNKTPGLGISAAQDAVFLQMPVFDQVSIFVRLN